jgi:phytoene desaturase
VTDKGVIIIGAGLAGLSAGIYARRCGYPCRIVEQHSAVGGVAAAWRRKDFLIDGGIHFMMAAKPGRSLHALYRELDLDFNGRLVGMRAYGRYVDENKGRRIDVTQDLDRLARDLKGYSGDDALLIDGLINGARRLKGLDLDQFGLSQPPELSGRYGPWKDLWRVRRAWRTFSGRFSRSMAEFTSNNSDPWLRLLMNNLFLPEVPVWFVCLVLALLAEGDLGYLKNGSPDLVQSLETRFRALGGEVMTNVLVEEVLVREGRACGVRLAGGEILDAQAVISAADGRSTLYGLLGERFLDKPTQRRYAEWKLVPSFLLASFGVCREFPQEVPFTVISLMHPFTVNNHKVDSIFLRIFNYSGAFAPKGKTVIQVEVEADFDYWNNLRQSDRSRYDAEKQRVAAEVLKRLDKHYPGLSGQVEMTDVATPATIWRHTRNHRGAYMAWLPTPKFFRTPIPRTLKGLEGFYMAGQWVVGGGVIPCLYSGRHAVQLLCRADKKPFRP